MRRSQRSRRFQRKKTMRRSNRRKSVTQRRKQLGGMNESSCRDALNKPTWKNFAYRKVCQARYGDENLRRPHWYDWTPRGTPKKSVAFTVHGSRPATRAAPTGVSSAFLKAHGMRRTPLATKPYLKKRSLAEYYQSRRKI